MNRSRVDNDTDSSESFSWRAFTALRFMVHMRSWEKLLLFFFFFPKNKHDRRNPVAFQICQRCSVVS